MPPWPRHPRMSMSASLLASMSTLAALPAAARVLTQSGRMPPKVALAAPATMALASLSEDN